MSTMKNEHMIYALGELEDGGGHVLIIGVTDAGLELLRAKKTLLIDVLPEDMAPSKVVIFHEPTKDACKAQLRRTGVPINEIDLDRL